MTKKRHNSDPYNYNALRYPQTEKVKEKNKKKSRFAVRAALLASAGVLYLGATHSDAVHEALRSSPNSVTEKLSEADYQAKVIRPALDSVDNQINSISNIKGWVDADSQANGSTTLSNESMTNEMSLTVSPDMLHYSGHDTATDGTYERIELGSIEVTRDEDGTSVVIEQSNSVTVSGRPMTYGNEIKFHNPDKDITVDLSDLSTLSQVIAAPESTVESVTAHGQFESKTDHDQAWWTEISAPLTVTFERNEDGSFDATTNADKLETGYGVNPKSTPTMSDILEFEFRE